MDIYVGVFEQRSENRLLLVVEDNGKGIRKEDLPKVTDPFYSRSDPMRNRVGLGLSLFYQDCKLCGGEVRIMSAPGTGTKVEGVMQYDHIDRQPLGDTAQLFLNLILQHERVAWTFEHRVDSKGYRRSIADIRGELGLDGFKKKSEHGALKEFLLALEHRIKAQ